MAEAACREVPPLVEILRSLGTHRLRCRARIERADAAGRERTEQHHVEVRRRSPQRLLVYCCRKRRIRFQPSKNAGEIVNASVREMSHGFVGTLT
jgi:hypothetical protein